MHTVDLDKMFTSNVRHLVVGDVITFPDTRREGVRGTVTAEIVNESCGKKTAQRMFTLRVQTVDGPKEWQDLTPYVVGDTYRRAATTIYPRVLRREEWPDEAAREAAVAELVR